MNAADSLKEKGMQLALFNESDDWKNQFLAFIEQRARSLPMFRMEDIRADWIAAGHQPPHHSNVFGAIAQHITKRGIGVAAGYVKSVSPATHGHPVLQYRSLLFREAA